MDKEKRKPTKRPRAPAEYRNLGGRPKLYGVRMLLLITDDTLASIDAVREGAESRSDVIRAAIERELKWRERSRARD